MKDFYIVTHQAGAGGAFLNTLIYAWLSGDDVTGFEFDEYGAAHGDLEGLPITNHPFGSNHPDNHNLHSSLDTCWKWLKAIDKSKPLCVRCHCLVDDTIDDYYPNHQHFHIVTCPTDYEIIAFNVYIKQKRFEVWPELSAETQIAGYASSLIDGYYHHHPDHKWWFEPYQRPNTMNILFKDMMTNPAKVHEQMAEVLGPVPDYIIQYHNNYIAKNIEVVNKYAPWIKYYETTT